MVNKSRVLDQVQFGWQQRWNEQVVRVPEQSHLKLLQEADDVLTDIIHAETVLFEQQHQIIRLHHSCAHSMQKIIIIIIIINHHHHAIIHSCHFSDKIKFPDFSMIFPANCFTALWILSGTTQVSWYQNKHSPTYIYPDHQSSFICLLCLLPSMASSLIKGKN